MEQDIIIVGAGASGLISAITAARKGCRVLIIEQKEKAGKKLLATGNGKCNYTNLVQKQEFYRSEDSTFAWKVLSAFDIPTTLNFFEELGILPKERDGYVYPNSEQAASVVQVLLMECNRLGVRMVYGEKVKQIHLSTGVDNEGFHVVTNRQEQLNNDIKAKKNTSKAQHDILATENSYIAQKLILATGGCAAPKLGSDGSGYSLAGMLGHSLIKPLPALVQLKASDKFCKTLSGVRIPGRATALSDNKQLAEEEGELLFTDYGISGIPIMQLSRFVAKAIDSNYKVRLLLDLLPNYNKKAVIELLNTRLKRSEGKNLEEMLIGLFPHKLSYVLIKEAGLVPELSCKSLKFEDLEPLAKLIKEFQLRIIDTNSFETAQVSAGGIPTKELNPDTMESKIKKNLYLCGELVDVDGTCGGYNLQWAWSSGYVAGSSAAKTNA